MSAEISEFGGRKAGAFALLSVSSLAAGGPDCDGGSEQRQTSLVGIHHTCGSGNEKRLIIS